MKTQAILLSIIINLVIFSACSTSECFESKGEDITISDYDHLPSFEKIVVYEHIQLILIQGDEIGIELTSGKNILPHVEVKVIDNELVLKSDFSCNYVRKYEPILVKVTHPNISRIRNTSQYTVLSEGTLYYDSLSLICEDNAGDYLSIGNFDLDLHVNQLNVVMNNFGSLFIRGSANTASIGFWSGASRFEGTAFYVNELKVTHKSSNDILINVHDKVSGTLYSTGNLILQNTPNEIDVETRYKGKVILKK